MRQLQLQLLFFIPSLILLANCESVTKETPLKEDPKKTWSGTPGDPNFSVADRLAIKDVMNAYSLYLDDGELEDYFMLFTDKAIKKIGKESTRKKIESFKSRGLKRRHLMANTHFYEQTDSTAYIKQYTLLSGIDNKKEFIPLTTLVYDVWLKKVAGNWKISNRTIAVDATIDRLFSSKR